MKKIKKDIIIKEPPKHINQSKFRPIPILYYYTAVVFMEGLVTLESGEMQEIKIVNVQKKSQLISTPSHAILNFTQTTKSLLISKDS